MSIVEHLGEARWREEIFVQVMQRAVLRASQRQLDSIAEAGGEGAEEERRVAEELKRPDERRRASERFGAVASDELGAERRRRAEEGAARERLEGDGRAVRREVERAEA